MKKWNYFLGLGLTVGALTLTACSDDDEPKTPEVPDLGIKAPVTSMANSDGVSTFRYNDSGAMTDGTDMYAGQFSINYAPFTVKASDESVGWKEAFEMNNIVTDGNGFITSASLTYKGEETYNGTTESWTDTGTLTCQYNAEGQLTKLVSSVTEEGDMDEDTYELTWQDGNIVSIHNVYRYKEAGEDWTDDLDQTVTFGYGADAVENSGIYMPQMADLDMDFLFYAGRFGKTCKQVPTSMTSREEGSSEYTVNISVDKDEDGRITALKANGQVYYVYAYDGETATFLTEYGYSAAARKQLRRLHR